MKYRTILLFSHYFKYRFRFSLQANVHIGNYNHKAIENDLTRLTFKELDNNLERLKYDCPQVYHVLNGFVKTGDRQLTDEEYKKLITIDIDAISFFGRKELTRALISFLKIMFANKSSKSSRRFMAPAAKTLSILYSKKLIKKEDFQEFIPLFKQIASEFPIEKMRLTMNNYLKILNDEEIFHREDMLSSGAFEAMCISAIEKGDVNSLRMVYDRFPHQSIHQYESVHKSFTDFYMDSNSPKVELLKLYADRIASQKQILDHNLFITLMSPILKNTPMSELNHLKMNPCSLSCPSCGENWRPLPKLNSEEHVQLIKAFEHRFIDRFRNFQQGTILEIQSLQTLIESLKMMPNFQGPKLVIDSLNLTRGDFLTDIPRIFGHVLKLKETYPGICIISRFSHRSKNDPIYRGQMERLRRAGIGIFHANQDSYDDLFTIFAALWLGEDTYILSNDLFKDIFQQMIDSVDPYLKNIWSKWYNSSMVRRDGEIAFSDMKILTVPAFEQVAQKTHKGYHFTTFRILKDTNRRNMFPKIYNHYCFTSSLLLE